MEKSKFKRIDMKKISKIFVATALACAAAVACTTYDDTEIQEAITDLQNRVTALEQTMADNVSAIQSMISLGSIQSFKIDAATGKAVITLIDGKTVTFDQEIVGYSVITVEKGENGEYYWALCVDGVTTPLLVDGKTVPVSVTPSLKISEQNEWLISADGGKTWVATGIYNQEGGAPSIFQDAKREGDTLILTLADGSEIKVAIVGEFRFAAAVETLYFSKEGLEKTVALDVMNVKAYTITEKPEGWKVSVDQNEDTYTLLVTSPADITAAESTGTIKILGLYSGGNCSEIISVAVEYETPFTLAAGVGDAVTVTVAEHSFEDTDGYIIGAVKASEYSAEAIVAWLNSEEGYITESHMESKEFQMTDLVADFSKSEAYVVFAVERIPVKMMLSGAASYSADDLQTVQIGSNKAKVSFSNIKFDSAEMSLEITEMTGYFAGYYEKGFWETYGMSNTLESINVGNLTPMTEFTYQGLVNLFPDGTETTQILPSTDYVVWIMPESETGTYSENDFILYSFTSAPIVADNSVGTPTCAVSDITYGGFSAKVTPAAGAYKTYAYICKTSALSETDEQIVADIINIDHHSLNSSVLEISANSFASDDEVCIVAVSVTADGHYGQLYKEIVPLKQLTYSDALSVSASSKLHGLGDVTLTLTFAGNPSTITYYCTTSSYFGDETMQDMLARGQVGDAVCDKKISELTDGNKIELSGLTLGTQHTFYALVKDADGVPSRMTKLNFTPIVMINYILSMDDNYTYGMPQITGSKVLSRYNLSIAKPAECVKYWLFVGDFEYMTGSSTVSELNNEYDATDKLLTKQLESVGALELTENYSTTISPIRSSTRIYMAWQDDKGEYHAVYTVNPNK